MYVYSRGLDKVILNFTSRHICCALSWGQLFVPMIAAKWYLNHLKLNISKYKNRNHCEAHNKIIFAYVIWGKFPSQYGYYKWDIFL